jgi:hypothetical protein
MKPRFSVVGSLSSFSVLLVCAASSNAQIVVRNSNAANEGTRNTFAPFNVNPVTYQMVINASELGALNVGDQITGLAFRLDNTTGSQTTGPTQNLTFADYDVYMGKLDDQWVPNFTSPNLASNYAPGAGGRVQVRDGSYILPANSLPGGSTPNAFGSDVAFNLNSGGYAYQGGSLIIEIRHSGNGVASPNLDANPNDAQSGARADFTSAEATEGLITQNAVVRLRVAPVPAPGALTVALMGALPGVCSVLRYRRRRTCATN